jgi:Protein of unknown function (DUF1269)
MISRSYSLKAKKSSSKVWRLVTLTTRLTMAASICAAVAGAIFIGVQINHPDIDTTSITTTEVVIRNSLKVLMAALALAGITGLYLRQVRRNGVLGLIGYLLLATGYLLILSTTFVSAYVLPSTNLTAAGAASGALWGTLIGLIFLMPVAGLAIGPRAGDRREAGRRRHQRRHHQADRPAAAAGQGGGVPARPPWTG